MEKPTVHPPALRPGDTIGIVAPAGPLEDREAFERGVVSLERLGFKVRFDERIFQSYRYLAGEDASRAEELMRYFEDPSIKGVLALRGGFGCSRLIPHLEEDRLRPHCKLFMGFSDLTTLHLFFRRRFGWVTIHGPMASSPSLAAIPPAQQSHLLSLFGDAGYQPSFSFPELETWRPGLAEGKLAGGCLSLLAASLGTPYELFTERRILFLEDLGEPPYRIDRMITQLKLAGKLDGVAGFLIGSFTECEPSRGDYTLKQCLQEILAELEVPVLANFPAGHGPQNWAIPLEVTVRIDAGRRVVEFLESAVAG
jgi:muramoyltetrapeptide carboxypeptidase